MRLAFLLVAATLFMHGCAGNLKTHARAAALTAPLIDDIAVTLRREAWTHATALQVLPEPERSQQMVELQRSYAPAEAAYETLRAAHERYVREILEASADGERTLKESRVELLLAAWDELVRALEAIGIDVPDPPPALAQLLGGKK